jgi:hypothetical protein
MNWIIFPGIIRSYKGHTYTDRPVMVFLRGKT